MALVALAGLTLYLSSHRAPLEQPQLAPIDAGMTVTGPSNEQPSTRDTPDAAARASPAPARVLLSPVEPAHYDGGPRPVTELAAVRMPKDRRDNPGPRAKAELEIVGYAFETLAEDVEECLANWDAMDAGATGEVMLVFQIDKKGLQKSWVDSAVELPFGPRSCIANAVYGLDWSNIVEQPAQISQRFELGRDAG